MKKITDYILSDLYGKLVKFNFQDKIIEGTVMNIINAHKNGTILTCMIILSSINEVRMFTFVGDFELEVVGEIIETTIPTLDELLDKISNVGMINLNEEELNHLNQYSNEL